jgi:hypothetical protein
LNDTNPIRILKILDSYLNEPIEVVVYGKAALHLLFQNDPSIGVTNDVDLIVPEVHVAIFDERLDFWEAMENTNQKLKSEGLYITHVFDEKQIVLHSTWFNSRLEIVIKDINNLKIFVPSPLDLILTKMMRIDPLDREDIRFIYEKANLDPKVLSEHLKGAVCPEIEEIMEAFEQNKLWLKSEGMA